MEPNPYALRRVTCSLSVVAAVWAANIRAPLRSTPAALGAAAGQHAGVVGQEDERQVEGVGHHDEVRRLVGGVGVDRAGQHLRLVGDDRDGMPAEVGQRADDRPAELRLDLEPVGASKTTSSTARMS